MSPLADTAPRIQQDDCGDPATARAGERGSGARPASGGDDFIHLGAYPSLAIGPSLESHQHDIDTILRESLKTEGKALALHMALLALVEGRSVMLEEYARQMVHADEVDKMLRRPGEIAAFRSGAA